MERLRQANSKEAQRQKLAAKLFDSCLARLKGCRAALLVSLRAARLGDATAAVTPSHAVAAAVRDVIRDELTAAGADDTDMLWAGERVVTRHQAPDDEDTRGDADALYAELEQFLTASLQEEEAMLLAEYEASLAFEDEAVAAAVHDQEVWESSVAAAADGSLADQPNGESEPPVPCPVCHRRRLLASRGVLFCGCGGIRLDLAAQGTGTLAFASERLAAAWSEHAGSGCPAQLQFRQHPLGPVPGGGGDSLWAGCESCKALIAVL